MTERQNIETAFEIARVFIYGESDWRDRAAWCPNCDGYVPLITLESAAMLEKTTIVTIFRRIERGELHYRTTTDGRLLACLGSLLNAGEKDKV